MSTDWRRRAESRSEPVEFQEAAGRNASAAEGAQEDRRCDRDVRQNAAEQADSRDTWKREKKLKFSYKEQREYETIEDDIANLEAKVEQLDADMAENATNSVKLGELLAEKEAAEQALEEKMERWEYLKNWRQRLQSRNEEYNVSFYKAVFFFLSLQCVKTSSAADRSRRQFPARWHLPP